MIKIHIYIRQYGWNLTVLFNVSIGHINSVADTLWDNYCPSNIAVDALKTIIRVNTGFCYTNYNIRSTVICISEATSKEQLVNTTVHELKHFQSHVSSYYGIDEKSEEAAYLIGDTAELLYNKTKEHYELGQD